ncbi:MAG: DUF4271 domain-containing protein [Bacteroidia bacterium]|nr:DUF4271 domain-containing protein [Bacteroidia bacterium]
MLENLLDGGVLEMSSTPFRMAEATRAWGDYTVNKIMVLLSVVCFFLIARDFVQMLPALVSTIDRAKANVSLERSLGSARLRNRVAFVSILPFCIVVDRFALYSPRYFQLVPQGFSVLLVILVLLVYWTFRHFVFEIFRPKKMPSEISDTVHRAPYNYFILLVVIMLLTVAAMAMFSCTDSVARVVLLSETAAFYLFSLVRVIQFLRYNCNVFVTFLYLCALEFLPTGMLVASAKVL